ncbi:MAG: PAS domain S-box protein [Aliarcobacter sp.]|nr:PAS domain S-box protein [Aliarcobacter sp.]
MESINFTSKYILALLILGFLSIFAYININTIINLQTNDSKTINLSGKQRMLSQRIYNSIITSNLEIFKESINNMYSSHNYLISLPMSKEVNNYYFNSPVQLDKKVNEYLEKLQLLQNFKDNSSDYLLEESESLLMHFDKITSLYQIESENKIKELKEVEFYILLMSLFTLLIVGFFIFRPANRKFIQSNNEILNEKNYSNTIIESNTNAIIAVEKNLNVKTFNKAAEIMFGYSKEEMIGKNSLLKIVPNMYQNAHENGIKKYFNTSVLKHKGINLEFEAIKKSGELFPIRISFGKNINEGENEKLVIANIQDITIEKEKEKLLMANEKIYKDLFELNKLIIILVNPTNGNIVNVNNSAIDFYGYTLSEFLSLNLVDINIIPINEIEEKMNFARENEQSFFEFVHKLSNNEQKHVRVSSSPTFYKDEIVLYLTITDITDELKAKDRLVSLEKEFNNFFEISINLHLITNTTGLILQINNACKNILGYDKEELVNKSFLGFIHPDDIEKTINEMKKLENYEAVLLFENRYQHKNGTYVTLVWSANIDIDNRLIYSSAQDITSIKLIEVEKERQEKMIQKQSKMASMGEMLENIAHQWRQPLSVISTASSGLKLKKAMNILEEDDIEFTVNCINNSVQHLSQTINDFRDFFHNEKNKNEFKINNTFEKTFNLISSEFKNKNIVIEQNIQDISIFSYENELIQVLINILNNAKDELIKKDTKEIKLIIIDTLLKDNTLEIYIKDNAGGIPADIIDNIFESHFTTKESTNGTGIGLYMSKMIIEEHLYGTIEAESMSFNYKDNSYYGAQFKISLPLLHKNKGVE